MPIAVRNLPYTPIYGVSWNKGSSPTLTRTDAAVGMVANAGVGGSIVRNDFDYASIYQEIKTVTDSLGNVFIRIPKFYIQKIDNVNYKTWRISKYKYPGFYLPWCFWDFTTGQELPYIDVGAYKATIDGSSRLQSQAGLCPYVNDNIVNFRTYAQNNNTGGLLGYQQLDIHVIDVLQTLFYVEFATLNSQSIMNGFVSGRYAATDLATVATTSANEIIVSNATAAYYVVGQTISVGTSQAGNQVFYGRTVTSITTYDANNMAITFDGAPVSIAVGNYLYNTGWKNGFSSAISATSGSIVSNTDGLHPCVYRGIESPWGDVWQFIDGININNNQAWIAKDASTYASNVFASPYQELAYVNANANGWVEEMGYDPNFPFAEFPVTLGGSGSTYYSDYYYQAAGQLMALLGGGWNSGSNAGLSGWNLYSSSGAGVIVGGRLLRKAS